MAEKPGRSMYRRLGTLLQTLCPISHSLYAFCTLSCYLLCMLCDCALWPILHVLLDPCLDLSLLLIHVLGWDTDMMQKLALIRFVSNVARSRVCLQSPEYTTVNATVRCVEGSTDEDEMQGEMCITYKRTCVAAIVCIVCAAASQLDRLCQPPAEPFQIQNQSSKCTFTWSYK